MPNSALSYADRPSATSTFTAVAALAAWLATVLWLGASGTFVSPPGTPPLPLLAGVVLPLAVFFGLFRLSQGFRDFVLAADLRLVTGLQAWRVAGFGFLALYAHGILPGAFAFPAGLGDMAIGAAAPWLVLYLSRDPAFAESSVFRAWNMLGILDLVVAVGAGALIFTLGAASPTGATTAPMARLPLVLVPAYLVPIFIMLHFSALYRVKGRS